MPTAIAYRDGKAIRTTVLSAADADKFVVLAAAVRDAQNVMRNKPEMDANGDALKGVTHDANVPYSESAPDDIYSVLPRLAELLGTHARATYSHLMSAASVPIPAPYHPAAALASQATTLGMLPTDGLAFDRTELITDGVPPVQIGTMTALDGTTHPVMAGGSHPTVRAYVRWRV
ncbi:MAG: hypothetical protein AB1593_04750 [Pseudomonadota bacterium]